RLLLQRLAQFPRARLDLVEQPHVLDRDHRLVGEGREQLHLLVGEGPYRGARQREHADRSSLAQQRRTDHGVIAAKLLCLAQLVFWIGLRIQNLNGCALEQGSTSHALTPGLEWYALHLILELGRPSKIRLCLKEAFLVGTSDVSDVCLAES